MADSDAQATIDSGNQTRELIEIRAPEIKFESDAKGGTLTRIVDLGEKGERRSMLQVPGDLGKRVRGERDLHDMAWLRSKREPLTTAPLGTVRMCDLFSGCGGISIGVREACRALELRMEPVLAWDILEGAERVYKHNFKPAFFRMDLIEKVVDGLLGDPITETEQTLLDEIGTIDLVVGGPPCQGNSDLNNHSRRKDSKNMLYLRMTRFIEIFRPKIAIIENVLTVRRAEDKMVQKSVKFLRGLGYGVDHGALRAMDFGVPQDRRRHFTVAILGEPFKFDSLNVGHIDQIRPVMWGIEDLKVVEGGSNFDTPATHQIQNKERIAWLFGEGWKDWEIEKFNQSGDPKNPHAYNLPDHRRPPCHQSGHNYPAVYGRMFPDMPSPCLTTGFGSTGQGRFVHPHEQRSLTPHEAARVQTFPDFFDFSAETRRVALQTLIGNAVPPLLAEHIALQLISRYHPMVVD